MSQPTPDEKTVTSSVRKLEAIAQIAPGQHQLQLRRVGNVDWQWRLSDARGRELGRGQVPGRLEATAALAAAYRSLRERDQRRLERVVAEDAAQAGAVEDGAEAIEPR